MDISAAYRSSRRNVSIVSAIGIAWSASQLNITGLSLGSYGNLADGASIPILISVLCLYTMFRCTLEFMMQAKEVRRWPLAKVDYLVTLYLVRFSILALAASTIARTDEMIISLLIASVIGALVYFVMTFFVMLIVMKIILFIMMRSGRTSVASPAIASGNYAMYLVAVVYFVGLIFVGLNIFNPFEYFGLVQEEITDQQIAIFTLIFGLMMGSIFLERKFTATVFSYVPVRIERKYTDEEGRTVYSNELNPEHPDYEAKMKAGISSAFAYRKMND